MSKAIRITVFTLAAALLLAGNVSAQQGAQAGQANAAAGNSKQIDLLELRKVANQAYRDNDYVTFRSAIITLNQAMPYNSDYMSLLVVAHALNGDTPAAYEAMLNMQQQGLTYDFNQSPDTESIRGTQVYEYVNDLMIRAGEPMGEATLMFELPESVVLATSVEWDESRQSWLIGNARDGAVFAVNAEGEATELLRANETNGLWGIFGLIVDEQNNRLWVSTSASEAQASFQATDAGRSAIVEFKLDSLELVQRYPVPVDARPHHLGSMVMTPAGELYAVDTFFPIIYRLEKGDNRLKPYLASGDMMGMKDVALSDDGKMMYVADVEKGIMVLNLEEKSAGMLQTPENLNLGGIEGLHYWNGHLVIVQNGIRPQRIMRLSLEDSGTRVGEVAPLAVALDFFDYPSFGVMKDGQLFFLANSHWISTRTSFEPLRFASTNVSNAPTLVNPDMQKFMEEVEKDQARRAAASEE